MTIRQSEAHTFIIRIRRQTAWGATDAEEWHGEVVHVPTQRSASFRGLRNVETVLVRLIAAGEPD
jgi:hypothetical protein